MPFLRVVRDKRGYETTYLMHWFREGNRQHSRILYVFRSPGGVRVGRPPLEPEVQRQLEARHPEIEFDWPAVLDNRQIIEPAAEQRRPRKRRRDEEGAPAPAVPAPQARAEAPQPQTPRFVVPPKIEGETPDAQVAFLRHWHPLIREQIEQRATDPSRREALLTLATRLDSSAWTDADEITAGLGEAAEALERLSHVFAKRRRRSRRKKTGADTKGASADAVQDDTEAVRDSGESVRDRTESVQDRTESAQDRTESVRDRTESVRSRTESMQDRTESAQDRTEPVQDRTEAVRDRTESLQDNTDE